MLSVQAHDAAWEAGERVADNASPANYHDLASIYACAYLRRLHYRRSDLSPRQLVKLATEYADVFLDAAFGRAQAEAERVGDVVRLAEVRCFYWIRLFVFG